jgi:hypothetical protein
LGYVYPYHTVSDGKKLEDGTRMEGTIDTELMVSRDTIKWTRVQPRTPFLACGEEGAWDAGMVFVMPEVVVTGEVRFYYGGYAYEHATQPNKGGIGLATLPLDRLVHLEAKGKQGTVTTKPFELAGTDMLLNADAHDGAIQIEVLDVKGQPLPGFRAQECLAIAVDEPRAPVRWRSVTDLANLAGTTVRLRFHLKGKAQLYAFQIVNN